MLADAYYLVVEHVSHEHEFPALLAVVVVVVRRRLGA